MTKRRRGRPTIFTQAIAAELMKAFRLGATVREACEFSGISKDSLYEWLKKGRKAPAGSELREFADGIPKARGAAKFRALGYWHAAMPKDWKAAAHWLAIEDPARYGPKVRVTLDQEFTDALTRIRRRLPIEVYEQVLAAIAEDESPGGVGADTPGEETGSEPH
jgi:hypothetical protein